MPVMNPRYTFAALMSLLLAIALATLSVAAPGRQQGDRTQLQPLVNELAGHIEFLRSRNPRQAELRLEMLAEALQSWNESGKTDADAAAMLSWLNQAIERSMPGARRSIAAVPSFSERVIVQVVPTPKPDTTTAPRDVTETKPPVRIAETPTAQTPAVETPTIKAPVAEPPKEIFIQLQEETPAKKPALPWEKPSEPNKEVPKVASVEKINPKRTPKIEETFQESPAKLAEPTIAKVDAKPNVWQRHPAASAIDLSDPFGDEGSSSTSTSRVAMRPTARTVGHRTRVEVNAMELGARVRGYVHGLRGVEARLLADSNMPAEQLLLVTRELRQLGNQRDMLSLYLETEEFTSSTGNEELPTLAYAKRMVTRRVKELERQGDPNDRAIDSMKSLLLAL